MADSGDKCLLERKALKQPGDDGGFKDILQIGRQNRPSLYDLTADPPAPLIPEERRLEVKERVDSIGSIQEVLEQEDIQEVVNKIQAAGCESVAVCLLFSFLNDQHEQALAKELRVAGVFTSVSSEVLPEFREYE
jgi:N-methylhydantoinase A